MIDRVEYYRKKRRKRRWIRIGTCFLLLILTATGYFGYQVWGAMENAYDPLDREGSKKRVEQVTVEDPFTVLLIGTDARNAEKEIWRPDVLMVAAVNPHNNSIKLLSIPRDTYTTIANTNGHQTKINHAAYYGKINGIDGVINTVETVEHFLNIPIDHYALINFQGFMEVVDALRGVDVEVPFTFTTRTFGNYITFKKGPAHLNGEEALAYVRMRKQDPRGDAGRNERQREVLRTLMDQVTSVNTIQNMDEILQSIGNNIKYDFEFNEILALQKLYNDVPRKNIEIVDLKGKNSKNNPQGLWFYYVSDEERLRVSHLFQKQLELPLETLDGKPYTLPSEKLKGINTEEQESPEAAR